MGFCFGHQSGICTSQERSSAHIAAVIKSQQLTVEVITQNEYTNKNDEYCTDKLECTAAGGNGPGFIVGQCVASRNVSGVAQCHVPHAYGLAVEYLGWHVFKLILVPVDILGLTRMALFFPKQKVMSQ